MARRKNEADFQTKFTPWAKENWEKTMGPISAWVELKKSDGKTLSWKKIEAHQYVTLEKSKHGTVVHKVSDSAIGFKPADTVIVCKGGGYLAVMFEIQKQMKEFFIVCTDVIDRLKAIPNKKSLTIEDCETYGYKIELK